MSHKRFITIALTTLSVATIAASGGARIYGQSGQTMAAPMMTPTNDAPNPYQSIEGYF